MSNSKALALFMEQSRLHENFIQSMIGIAYNTHNKEMQQLISEHMTQIRALYTDNERQQDNVPMPRTERNSGLDATDLTQGNDFSIIGNGGKLS